MKSKDLLNTLRAKLNIRPAIRRDLREKSVSERLPERIYERVYQDFGEASMCWSRIDKAGVFESERVSIIAHNLCQFIADELDKARHGV